MNDKSIEADNNQSPQKKSSQEASEIKEMFSDEEPPKENWATYQIFEDGKVIESFKVPFTQEELDLIMILRKKKDHPGLLKGFADGGPERQHRQALQIPFQHGLDNRKEAIAMLRQTAKDADKILKEGKFTPGLNSQEPISEIRDALKPLIG